MRKNGPMERYPGIDEDARNHIVPGSNTIDNSPRPKGVKRGQGEDGSARGPGGKPHPGSYTGPGIGLKK